MTKPDAWTLSPQMTAAPELWRNAVVWPWWHGSDRYYGQFSEERTSKTGTGTLSFANTPYGGGVDFDGNYLLNYTSNEHVAPNEIFTFATIYRIGFGGGDGFRYHISTTPNNTNGIRFMNNAGSSNRHRFRLLTSNGGMNADVDLNYSAGDMILWVMRYDGSTMFNHVQNLTQGTESETTASQSGSITHESTFTYGGDSGSGTDTTAWEGTVLVGVMTTGEFWTDNKRNFFVRDPFSMLRPAGF